MLLPTGLKDILSPAAGQETALVAALMHCFQQHGFAQVKPPLVEFEETLLSGDKDVAAQTFRLMDPASQKMMGLRTDMTLQVTRVAQTRLKTTPRPLRLCYCGEVLRVSGTQLTPERQFCQVGAEIFGAASPRADVELIVLAVQGLNLVGLTDLCVDLHLPTLMPALCDSEDLKTAIARRDSVAAAEISEPVAALIDSAGDAEETLKILNRIDLPESCQSDYAHLIEVYRALQKENITLTIDPVEQRGFEYHTGLAFTLFSKKARAEIGRGGHYQTSENTPATGFTVFMDRILPLVSSEKHLKKILVPFDMSQDCLNTLHEQGFQTVKSLGDGAMEKEARRLGCTAFWDNTTIKEL